MQYVLIGTFGLLGVFARYGTNSLAVSLGYDFPAATIAINILGSFFIGIIYVAGAKSFSGDLNLALMTGLMGGFTTFSAFSLDAVSFFNAGRYMTGGLYILSSVGGGIVATFLGLYLGKIMSA